MKKHRQKVDKFKKRQVLTDLEFESLFYLNQSPLIADLGD